MAISAFASESSDEPMPVAGCSRNEMATGQMTENAVSKTSSEETVSGEKEVSN